MSREHNACAPLVAPHEARLFASLLSRLAAAFDLASLSTAEAIFLANLLDHCTRALWLVHGAELLVHLPCTQDNELQDHQSQDDELF